MTNPQPSPGAAPEQAAGLPTSGPGAATPLLFQRVYSEHAVAVHSFCVSQVGDWGVAEDLTHETFIRAFAAYGRVHPDKGALRTWLVAIARNLCRDHHRARRRWHRLAVRVGSGSRPAPTVEESVQTRADLRRVVAGMAELGARDRELIGLRVAAGLSHRQIGELMGLSEATAKVASFRALNRLRKRLGVEGVAMRRQLEAKR